MKTHLLKTSQGIALKIDGVVSDCKLELDNVLNDINKISGIWDRVECTVEMEEINTPFGSGLQPKITDGKIKVLTLIK